MNRSTSKSTPLNPIETTETRCFFGCTNVCMGTRIIAFVQFWLEVLYFVMIILQCSIELKRIYLPENGSSDQWNDEIRKNYDLLKFSHSFIPVIHMYSCYYLQKSTYTHNVQDIEFWIKVNYIDLLMTGAYFIYFSLRIKLFEVLISGGLICIIFWYKLHIVNQFHTDEMNYLLSFGLNTQNETIPNNTMTNNEEKSSYQSHVVETESEIKDIINPLLISKYK